MTDRILIVGTSHAGIQIATSLRQNGCEDKIVMVGEEPLAPYQKPPLSKSLHLNPVLPTTLLLRLPVFFNQQHIDLRTGDGVTTIDHARRQARTRSGSVIEYTKLALAVGARARRLLIPGADSEGIFHLRTYADAVHIAEGMQRARDIVVVGAGLIGMEFAALAARQGCAVTVVELGSAIMQRVASAPVCEFMHSMHRGDGIQFLFGRTLCRIAGDGASKKLILLDDGTELKADAVIVGIGSEPRVELAREMGLDCEGGIVVDAHARASMDGVVAAGDCTRQPNRHRGGEGIRYESISNAVEQAKVAAAALQGELTTRSAAPWFWSDQGGLRFQSAGVIGEADEHAVEFCPDGRRLAVRHYRAGELVAIECVNSPGEFLTARRQLDSGSQAHSAAIPVSETA